MTASSMLIMPSPPKAEHTDNRAQSNQHSLPSAENQIDLSGIISAFSFALDLTEGAIPGHALRSCVLGMRIGLAAGLGPNELRELYYALLLKDIGCSSNAARMCQIVGGDDRAIKAGVKLEDWTKPHQPSLSTLRLLWKNVLPDANPAARIARIAQIGLTQHKNNKEMISLRCDRGATIVRKMGLGDHVANAIQSLDEHWNGAGYPEGLRGQSIPLYARILAIAQHLDAFASDTTPQHAIDVLERRSGVWFDPDLAGIAVQLNRQNTLWQECLKTDSEQQTRSAVSALEQGAKLYLQQEQIDMICEAFSDVVDAKSPFTSRHSLNVTNAAVATARMLGLSAERVQFVRRAALLHDLGKLRVPNSILDKRGKLTEEEFSVIKEHPGLTRQILERVSAFKKLGQIASEHHEKLDGSGYPDRLGADQLGLESRIIGVADVYAALAEDRPYRASLNLGQIHAIMSRDVPHKMDGACYEALLAAVNLNEISA